MKLFSGSSQTNLSEEAARMLSIELGKAETLRFADSEGKVTIQEPVKNEVCVIVQSTSNPTDMNFIELCLFCDALKRSEASKVIGVIPYFGYSRQDRQHRPGESVSMNVVVRFLELVGFEKIITFELHEEASADMFSIPFMNISALPVLASQMHKDLPELTIDNTVIVSPDQEGIERARLFSESFFNSKNGSVSSIEKHRDLDVIHQSKAVKIFADVKDKTVILVDDVTTSGGTLINAADLCIDQGATAVFVSVTHHDFSLDAPQKFQDSSIMKIYTTNTIRLTDGQKFAKLQEVSIASLIADSLKD